MTGVELLLVGGPHTSDSWIESSNVYHVKKKDNYRDKTTKKCVNKCQWKALACILLLRSKDQKRRHLFFCFVTMFVYISNNEQATHFCNFSLHTNSAQLSWSEAEAVFGKHAKIRWQVIEHRLFLAVLKFHPSKPTPNVNLQRFIIKALKLSCNSFFKTSNNKSSLKSNWFVS